MFNFHGSTVPRGWSRTYPHLMSMEAVFGAEQYNNGSRMTDVAAQLNTTLPFTRNVVGPMDFIRLSPLQIPSILIRRLMLTSWLCL